MKLSPSSLAVALGCVLLLAGCAVNPVTGNRNFTLMSEDDEVRKGWEAALEIRKAYRTYEDLPALQQYVNEIGQKLAKTSHRPRLDYHFTVLDSPEVNAFALPGGHVYITRGILAYLNSEAELAAVLGHEIAHVTARHSVQQYSAATAATVAATVGGILVGIFMPQAGSQLAQGVQSLLGITGNVLLAGYGRGHELEADRLGAEYLARSGYDPQAMIKVIGALKNQELFDIEVAKQEGREPRRYHGIFATHPDNDTRLQEVVGEAAQYAPPGKLDDHRKTLLRQIEGLAFGDAADQGIVRANTLQHKELGFSVSFPPGWEIRNKRNEVVATSPDRKALMVLSLFDKPSESPAELARERFRLGPADISSVIYNGLPVAIVNSTTDEGKPFKAGVIYHDTKAYLLAGAGETQGAFDRYRPVMTHAIESFRALSDAERKAIRPLEIRTITADQSTRYKKLAQDSPLGRNAENHLRLLNGMYPEGEPVSGQILKIVR